MPRALPVMQVQPVTDPRTGTLLAMLVAIEKADKDSQDCLFRTHCFTESDRCVPPSLPAVPRLLNSPGGS